MKLEKILDKVNSLEKNSFLKIIDSIKSASPKNAKEIDNVLSGGGSDLKSVDSINIAKVFELVKNEYAQVVKAEFVNTTSQLDILIDILIKDGCSILKREWFLKLYEKELVNIKKRTKILANQIDADKSDIEQCRVRDYKTYRACVRTAYYNDESNNRDTKVTDDELSILVTLMNQLELSQEEVKLINYMVITPQKNDIDEVINFLKTIGVIFYSKKNNLIYVADEVVRVLRGIREKEIADKYFRRVLKTFREPQINLICRKHNISIKEDYDVKIKQIIREGISFSNLLTNEIYKEGTTLTDRKKFVNELWSNGLKAPVSLKGTTLEEKINNIIIYFSEIERDEKVGISVEGYERLLIDLNDTVKGFRKAVLKEFVLQDEIILNSATLLDFNIKPRDILDVLSQELLKEFVIAKDIKSRGDLVANILDTYKDAENLLIENFEAIGYRNLAVLKENGIMLKEAELGLKFEDLTKRIFEQLGFNVDEALKKTLNNAKNKIDVVLNLGDNNIMILECKTVKDSAYNKFSSVTRQVKSYVDLAEKNGYTVMKSLLVAPEFSEDFINDCDLDFEINLSLITAGALVKILDGFRESKHKQFPYQLLMKDVLIREDRVLKAIRK